LAGQACLLMRRAGCHTTKPSRPDLLAGLGEGVTLQALSDTVTEALSRAPPVAKPFVRAIHCPGTSSRRPQATLAEHWNPSWNPSHRSCRRSRAVRPCPRAKRKRHRLHACNRSMRWISSGSTWLRSTATNGSACTRRIRRGPRRRRGRRVFPSCREGSCLMVTPPASPAPIRGRRRCRSSG